LRCAFCANLSPAGAADCCYSTDSIHVSLSLFGDATAHYFSFMMLSNINRAEGCEKGKLVPAAGKNNATPSASQLPRDETVDRARCGALVKSKSGLYRKPMAF
jgi:hypothetical protein